MGELFWSFVLSSGDVRAHRFRCSRKLSRYVHQVGFVIFVSYLGRYLPRGGMPRNAVLFREFEQTPKYCAHAMMS